MANNSKKYQRIALVIIVLLTLISNISNGQQFLTDSLQSFEAAYKTESFIVGANFSKLSTEFGAKNNSGIGCFIHWEKEVDLSQITTINGQIGASLLTSTLENGVHSPLVVGPQALVGMKFRISNSISLLYGASAMYFFITQSKSKLNEGYHEIKYFDKFQPGVYAGIELYMKDWMNMRIYAQNYTNNFSINIAFTFPKSIFFKNKK